MKFNVVMARRGRDEHYKACMKYLHQAKKDYDVDIHVVNDSGTGDFHKAALLNTGLQEMRQDFDFVSIVDVDIVYNPSFFDMVSKLPDSVYMVSKGHSLDQYYSHLAMYELSPFEVKFPGRINVGRSQVTMSKKVYGTLLAVIGSDRLYDERFIGWGAEDAALSCLSTHCVNQGLMFKMEHDSMWYHLWHEAQPGKTEQAAANGQLLQVVNDEYRAKAQRFKEEVKHV